MSLFENKEWVAQQQIDKVCDLALYITGYSQQIVQCAQLVPLAQIINVSTTDHTAETKATFAELGIDYKWRPFNDDYGTKARVRMLEVALEVHKDMRYPCLVHCAAGISRSVSIVIFHLMSKWGVTADEALRQIRKSRAIADPNDSFMDALKQRPRELWEEYLTPQAPPIKPILHIAAPPEAMIDYTGSSSLI